MQSLLQWGTLLNLLVTLTISLLAVFFVRAKGDEIGKDTLRKTLAELRSQIGDRDRAAIGLREQIEALTQRVLLITAEQDRKEAQMMALLSENLELKDQLKNRRP